MGGCEYRVETMDGARMAWVAANSIEDQPNKAQLREMAKSAPRVASSFREYITRGATDGESEMARAARARVAHACENSGGASEADMREVWDMFETHASGVAAHADEVRDANMWDATTDAGRRGQTWVCEPWRTVYLGGREEDPGTTDTERAAWKKERERCIVRTRACPSERTCLMTMP